MQYQNGEVDMIEAAKVWEGRIWGSVKVKQPGDVHAIALRCVAAQERGELTSVWHETAQFYGYQERCNCVPCSKSRLAR